MAGEWSWWEMGISVAAAEDESSYLGWSTRWLVHAVDPSAARTWLDDGARRTVAGLGDGQSDRVTVEAPTPVALRDVPVVAEADGLSRRRFRLVDGVLAPDHPEAQELAATWMSASEGRQTSAEATMNHVHLWDLLDESAREDDEYVDWDDRSATDPDLVKQHFEDTLAIAYGWQRGFDDAALGVPVVIEVTDGGPYGPEVTAFLLRHDD